MTNGVKRDVERAIASKAVTLMGLVSAYDPAHYAAKVLLQPDGTETGFLPIASVWVGNGFGFYAAPNIGDMVDVHFQEAGKGAPYVSLRFYGNNAQPLPVPAGECWMVHQSGSYLKFFGDGTVGLHAATALNSSAPLWTHTGNVIVNGMIQATGDIWDNYTSTGYTMASFRARYDIHVHGGVDNGSGTTTAPTSIL